MKNLIRFAVLALSLCLFAMVYYSCSLVPDPPVDDGEEPVEEPETGISSARADSLLNLVSFTSSTKVTGSVPSVANTAVVKINRKDTIYTMPGLSFPIRLSTPNAGIIGGLFVSVKNSTFHYDVELDDTEDSDTVVVVLIGVPEEFTDPYSIPLIIAPYDKNKEPIDTVDTPVKVEEGVSNLCDIYSDYDPNDPLRSFDWIWRWTISFNANDKVTFINSLDREFITNTNQKGCCPNDNIPCPLKVCDPNNPQKCTETYDSEVNASIVYSINGEFFNFYRNGTYERNTYEYIKNFDPVTTDWCNRVTAYNERTSGAFEIGTYTYSGSNITLTSTISHGCDGGGTICGFGTRWGDVRVTCHALQVETPNFDGGGKTVRLYSRGSNVNAENEEYFTE
jgi:hypothetical protein